jgi:hypothetical protein
MSTLVALVALPADGQRHGVADGPELLAEQVVAVQGSRSGRGSSVRSIPMPKKTVSDSENGTPKRIEPPGVASWYWSPRLFVGPAGAGSTGRCRARCRPP